MFDRPSLTGQELTFHNDGQLDFAGSRYHGLFDSIRDAHREVAKEQRRTQQAAEQTVLKGAQTATHTELISQLFDRARFAAGNHAQAGTMLDAGNNPLTDMMDSVDGSVKNASSGGGKDDDDDGDNMSKITSL